MADRQSPWVEKYRPQEVSEVLGHHEAIKTIRSFLRKGELPHILLHGPPGTGKTSLVQSISRALYGRHVRQMVLELNASDDRGIAVVRNQIRTFCQTKAPILLTLPTSTANTENSFPENGPAKTVIETSPGTRLMIYEDLDIQPNLRRLKLVVLDEVDQMTIAAQTALRRIMEKHAANVRFFLMCNDVWKIGRPVQSRCTAFRFAPLPRPVIKQKLRIVLSSESLVLTPDGEAVLIDLAGGDFRKILNVLQTASLSFENQAIHASHILDVLGLPNQEQVFALFDILMTKDLSQSFQAILSLLRDGGFSVTDIVTAIYKKSVDLDWPNDAALTLFPRIAEIQLNMASGADEKIQAAALAATFTEVKEVLKREGIAAIPLFIR